MTRIRYALLACGTVLSSTVLIPAVRAFMSDHHGAPEASLHAFMTVNLIGGAIGAPLVARWAERLERPQRLLTMLCALDGLLLLSCLLPLPLELLLSVRAAQGAANLGGLSLIMGAAAAGPADEGRSMGQVGAAVMVGVALGSPVGTAALGLGPWGPVAVGGLVQLAVAVGTLGLPSWQRRAATAKAGLGGAPKWPAVWVGVERFGVGALVVSFAIFAREVHGLTDVEVGLAFAWFMVPFVLVVYPAARLASDDRRGATLGLGLGGYGFALASLGVVPPALVPLSMLVCGVSSAFVYGASLRAATSGVHPARRGRAMAAINAAGGAGMLVGTAAAGIVGTLWRRAGGDATVVFPAIFAGAGLCQWLVALTSLTAVGRIPSLPEPGPETATP